MECIFCKMIKGEIPVYKVYEDDSVLAFLDASPAALGHTLVIPKNHYPDFLSVEGKDLPGLMTGLQKTAKLLKEKLAWHDFQIVQNNGPAAGQVIFHLHFHIIPRTIDDDCPRHWGRVACQPEDKEALINKINS